MDRQLPYKDIPKVDRLLAEPLAVELTGQVSRAALVREVRAALAALRRSLKEGHLEQVPPTEQILMDVRHRLGDLRRSGVRRAVNATGVILHTALGRAPLAPAARRALEQAATRYCTLQIDLATGKRGDRYASVQAILRELTGAEAALVVNNNAAATMLVLNTLAAGKEVIVSRGELVEIGGSFRIPDILLRSGARLVEVGTTNRTHLKDYQRALGPETGLLLKVHKSNYRIIGFTSEAPIGELAALAHTHGIPAVDDIGSGALLDLTRWGLPREPMVQESLQAGADAVCFSGDKLLGGPQCGIIVGSSSAIEGMKSNPLMRVLRCDKLVFAALEATLRLFLNEEALREQHPVMQMLAVPAVTLQRRCRRIRRAIVPLVPAGSRVAIERDSAETGSGALAAVPLETFVVTVAVPGLSAEELARALRTAPVPVVGRVRNEMLLLDARTIADEEVPLVADAVRAACAGQHASRTA